MGPKLPKMEVFRIFIEIRSLEFFILSLVSRVERKLRFHYFEDNFEMAIFGQN